PRVLLGRDARRRRLLLRDFIGLFRRQRGRPTAHRNVRGNRRLRLLGVFFALLEERLGIDLRDGGGPTPHRNFRANRRLRRIRFRRFFGVLFALLEERLGIDLGEGGGPTAHRNCRRNRRFLDELGGVERTEVAVVGILGAALGAALHELHLS